MGRAGRLLKTDYKLNELPPIVLAENKYNELGQLESSTPVEAANLKQRILIIFVRGQTL